MVQVAKLSADLEANTSNFDTNLKKSSGLLGQVKRVWMKELKDIDGGFDNLGKSFAKGVGAIGGIAVAAGTGLAILAKKSADAADAVGDTAQRLQIGTTELQKFQYAAKLSASDNETLEAALTKLNAKIADGSFKYKNAAEGLYSIAEAVKLAKTDTERLAIANDAFGAKMGSKMIPLLAGGADGLRALGDEAERVGAVLSTETLQAAAEFNDTIDVLTSVLQKNFQQGLLSHFADQSGEIRDVYTDPQFTEGIRNVGSEIGALTELLLESVSALGRFIAAYRELENSGSFGMDEKLFTWLNNLDPNDERRARGQAQLRAKYQTKDYGTQFGPFMPTAENGGAVTPFVPSKVTKDKEAAAKKATEALKKQQDAAVDILRSLELENENLEIQTTLYGQKEGAVARATRELQINSQLEKAGITLSKEQRAELEASLDVLEQLTDKQKEQTEATRAQQEADRDRAQAFAELGATFSSAFEDAVLNGEDLSDVLNSLLADIAKITLRTRILQPLMNSLFGNDGQGGLLSGVFGSIGSMLGFPSHATGIDYVPRDMMVRVHKGEEIVSRSDVDRQSRDGGDLTVNIVDRNNSDISAQQQQNGNGMQLDVIVDRATAKNIAKPGSQTSQAFAARNNRTLVRR